MRSNKNNLFILIFFVNSVFFSQAYSQNQSKLIDINDFGAVGDGASLCTTEIQTAIDSVSNSGGGKIIFPKGKYLTGSLILKSGVNLHLEKDAVILGSINPYDYNELEMKGRPATSKTDDNSQMALIVAYKADNISITGKGTIDGQGRALALNIDSLHHAGIKIDPKYNKRRNRPNETARPKLFRFSTCKNILIKNVELRNSACWGLSFELCRNLTLDSLTIFNRAYWNNDGMDITDCQNVRVTNCDVNSADDGITLKSYYEGYCNDSLYIANCTVRSSASGVKFGTASIGGFKNITIENIKVFDTFRSAIAIESVDGCEIENVNVSNIVAKNTGNAIFIRLGHRSGDSPGSIKNVTIKNIKVEIPFGIPDINYDIRGPAVSDFHNPFPASITGIPGWYVEDIKLENIEIIYPGRASKGYAYLPLWRLDDVPEKIKNYPEFHMFGELPSWGFYVRHAKGITMKNVVLKLEEEDFRPAFVFDDVIDLSLDEIDLPDNKITDQIILKNVSNFKFNSQNNELVKRIH